MTLVALCLVGRDTLVRFTFLYWKEKKVAVNIEVSEADIYICVVKGPLPDPFGNPTVVYQHHLLHDHNRAPPEPTPPAHVIGCSTGNLRDQATQTQKTPLAVSFYFFPRYSQCLSFFLRDVTEPFRASAAAIALAFQQRRWEGTARC